MRRSAAARPPNFDCIAPLYRWLEYLTLGPLLEQTRNHFLPALVGCRSALVLGDGDGRFTARMLALHPGMQVRAVDLSRQMLRLLEARVARVGAGDRLQTTLEGALQFTPDNPLDLVVTHFFLDCLTQQEVELLLKRLRPSLAEDALWLVSDFQVPPGWLRVPAWLLIRALYAAFRVLTGLRVTQLPAYGRALKAAGFHKLGERSSIGGLLVTELWRANGEREVVLVET